MASELPLQMPQPRVLPTCITVMFFITGLLLVPSHEMWLDELQPWLMANHSESLAALLAHSRYQGHPPLWYLFVWLISLAQLPLAAMQYAHLGIATAMVYIFARYAPFSIVQKILFTLGYYPLYEYCSITRNYSIEVVFIFLICVLWRYRTQHFILLGLCLFALSTTNVFGLIIAIILATCIAGEKFLLRFHPACSPESSSLAPFITISALTGVGMAISMSHLLPPADAAYSSPWYLGFYPERFYALLSNVRNAYLAVPGPRPFFWHMNMFQGHSWIEAIAATFSLGCVVASGILLRKKVIPLFIFAASNFVILLFFYVKYLGSPRHHGQLFIIFIATLWIASFYKEPSFKGSASPGTGTRERHLSFLLTIILAIHAIGGVKAQIHEHSVVFSAARETADYLKSKRLESAPLVGYPDVAVAPLLGYLGNQVAFFPQGHRFGSFVRWDTARLNEVSIRDVICSAQRLANRKKADAVLALNYELPAEVSDETSIRALQVFKGMQLLNEDYYLYLVSPEASTPGQEPMWCDDTKDLREK